MSLAQLLADDRYLALFVGSLLDGETLLVLAGFAAHQGYPVVLAVAFVGGTRLPCGASRSCCSAIMRP